MKARSLLLLLFLFTLLFGASHAEAATVPKSLAYIFAGVPNIDTTKVYPRTSAEYANLSLCQNTATPATVCAAVDQPKFYNLAAPGADISDIFNIVNRCVATRGAYRYAKDTSPTAAGALVFGAGTVTCTGVLPDEVVTAHLVVCYTNVTGAYCSYATVCFEGTNVEGQCSKDYVGELFNISNAGAKI